MSTLWIVAVSYPGYSTRTDAKLERIVGQPRSGSGMGMGWRDLDWSFDNEVDADKADEALQAAGVQTTRTTYNTENDQ